MNEVFAYVDFDDERLVGLQTNQLNDILEVLYKIYGDFHYIFFDEIQAHPTKSVAGLNQTPTIFTGLSFKFATFATWNIKQT